MTKAVVSGTQMAEKHLELCAITGGNPENRVEQDVPPAEQAKLGRMVEALEADVRLPNDLPNESLSTRNDLGTR